MRWRLCRLNQGAHHAEPSVDPAVPRICGRRLWLGWWRNIKRFRRLVWRYRRFNGWRPCGDARLGSSHCITPGKLLRGGGRNWSGLGDFDHTFHKFRELGAPPKKNTSLSPPSSAPANSDFLNASNDRIPSSMVPCATKLMVCTCAFCPSRCTRPVHCSSTAGFHGKSMLMTVEAVCCKLRPTLPASLERNTRQFGSFLNCSINAKRAVTHHAHHLQRAGQAALIDVAQKAHALPALHDLGDDFFVLFVMRALLCGDR